jgi:dinuclear metal center YbgI/SA1388 family protein
MTTRRDILDWCDHTLQTRLFQDYAPNGLQVEGRDEVAKIITAVTASRAAIDYAAGQGADMLLVHHGMFWKNEPITITGWKKQRIATLLQHQINLAGYHLPLDAHPELGNNACLAKRMGWQTDYACGEQNLLHIGRPDQVETLSYWAGELMQKLGRAPVVVGDEAMQIKKIAWCTGGAQGFFRRPSMRAWMLLLPARFPKRNITWPTKPAWPLSAPATMPQSATACRLWGRLWRRHLMCRCIFLTNKILHKIKVCRKTLPYFK